MHFVFLELVKQAEKSAGCTPSPLLQAKSWQLHEKVGE